MRGLNLQLERDKSITERHGIDHGISQHGWFATDVAHHYA